MSRFGSTSSNAEVVAANVRKGSIPLTALELTKAVTFAEAMPSANYQVFLQPALSTLAAIWPSGKSTSGFTINLSVGIVGDISYLVVED